MFLDGRKIGLFGGSFDPPHLGHVHFSVQAIKQFNLDKVIWLISPGNPLKNMAPAPIQIRLRHAQNISHNPNIIISKVETEIGARYSWETLDFFSLKYPRTKFVWLMGSDNLAQFHLWKNWRWIIEHYPIGVLARPEFRQTGLNSKVARIYKRNKLPANEGRLLPNCASPKWCFSNMPLMKVSSSEIRKKSSF
jgi:nicotinate-nucleotide adenylyltransferase